LIETTIPLPSMLAEVLLEVDATDLHRLSTN